jgi:DNA polymerase III delta prime subunit
MSVSALEMAREGRLYPSVILHGGSAAARRQLALELARALLCEAEPAARPCGACRHCRRIRWPEGAGDKGAEKGEAAFHPDFLVLQRDLKTSTSVDAARELLRAAQVSPFEARGQVFVVASAESLSAEAANALLKVLEEPHRSAPRHFFLLAPSRLDLLPTLRSRSLSLFLGPAEPLDAATVARLTASFGSALARYRDTGAAIYLLAAAEALSQAGGWDDPRSGAPWGLAAAAVVRALKETPHEVSIRRSLLALAEDLLGAVPLRLRGVTPERILEGLVCRHLA